MTAQLELPEYWIARPEFMPTDDETKHVQDVQESIGAHLRGLALFLTNKDLSRIAWRL